MRRLCFLSLLLVAACSSVPRTPSSAPDTARLDEASKAHASEMGAHLDAIEAAIPIVGGEGIAAPLAAARAEESDHLKATADKIATIESKAAASASENDKLRERIADLEATKFGILRWLLAGGIVGAALGVGLCFMPLARMFGVGVIAAGLAVATFAIAFELAIPWLKIAVPIVVVGGGAAIVWQAWTNRRAIVQLVRGQEIAKTGMTDETREAMYGNGGTADRLQSTATKRIVAAVRETLPPIRPLTPSTEAP